MRTILTGSAFFSLLALMIIPVAYAEVTEVAPGKSFYTIDEKISFSGVEDEGSVLVNVIVENPNGNSKLLGRLFQILREFLKQFHNQ